MWLSEEHCEQLLRNRHTQFVFWEDACEAMSVDGNKIPSNLEKRMTIHDCINTQRLKAYKRGFTDNISEIELLKDFIVEQNAQC